MLVVLPFCLSEAPLARLLVEHIGRLGGCQGHKVLIATTPDAAHCAEALTIPLRAAGFDRVDATVLHSVAEIGWPGSPNQMFREVARLLALARNPDAWYFMEVDNTPLTADWLGALATEHNTSRLRFCGAVVDTEMRANGVPFVDGKHMVGTGVYPANFFEQSTLVKYIPNHIPWDIYLQWEIVPAAKATTLIQNNWATKNYRLENGRILCEEANEYGKANPVRPGAKIVHGCKDGSLIRLLQQGAEVGGGKKQDGLPRPPVSVPSGRAGKTGAAPSPLPFDFVPRGSALETFAGRSSQVARRGWTPTAAGPNPAPVTPAKRRIRPSPRKKALAP